MSEFDFSTLPSRRQSGSLKWDLDPNADPYWVADMDFPSPPCIVDALRERVEHAIYGYALEPHDLKSILVNYMQSSHGAHISPDWIIHMGGCVSALSTLAMAVCSEGDSIMTCGPVYPPIRTVHEHVPCAMIEVPHIFRNGQWTFDWEAMEQAVLPTTKLFVLSNPQNPFGRVFSKEEIVRLAEFCRDHHMILCSDEIHCDLVLDEDCKHYSAMCLPDALRQNSVTLTAPSKTYNIAGIGYTVVIIPSEELRKQFHRHQYHVQPMVHCLAYAAGRAAYLDGEPWRKELIAHLRKNRDELYSFVSAHMPGIRMAPMQATYLAWMDCSALGIANPQAFFREKAGVFLNNGADFGAPSCVRFNFGTTREYMLQGLEKMASALQA